MPKRGPALVHAVRMSEGTADATAHTHEATMTEDCKDAAASTVRDNNGPRKSQNRSSAAQTTSNLTDSTPMPETVRELTRSAKGLSQQHLSAQGLPARKVHPLPQRPESHKRPPDAAKMSRNEICRNFLAGCCRRGSDCHRVHVVGLKPCQLVAA
ncbi:hypothetical protein BD414DRAFT_42189 [Trametes punicea]|nr:hypothetical protein BD414DRAFT_42189 [Trametes punicea]